MGTAAVEGVLQQSGHFRSQSQTATIRPSALASRRRGAKQHEADSIRATAARLSKKSVSLRATIVRPSMASRPGTTLLSRNASLSGQIAVSCRPQQFRWAPSTVAQKCFTAQSRCIDRPNVHARRLSRLAAKPVEALDEGAAPTTLSVHAPWYLTLPVWPVTATVSGVCCEHSRLC